MRKLIWVFILALGTISCSTDDEIVENYEQNLIGKWKWISTCGGYMNGCLYSDQDNVETIEFKTGEVYIQIVNGEIITKSNYTITDTIDTDSEKLFKLEFKDGSQSYFFFVENNIRFQIGNSWKEYSRITK